MKVLEGEIKSFESGLVKHDGKWIAKAEYQEIDKERQKQAAIQRKLDQEKRAERKIMWDRQAPEREKQLKIARERLKKQRAEKFAKAIQGLDAVKNGEKPEYDTDSDLLDAFTLTMPNRRFPENIDEQKKWVKAVLGKPHSAVTGVLNRGNYVCWEYHGIMKNKDTERHSEDISIAFTHHDIIIQVSGPDSSLGNVGGGIRDKRGLDTITYESLKRALEDHNK